MIIQDFAQQQTPDFSNNNQKNYLEILAAGAIFILPILFFLVISAK